MIWRVTTPPATTPVSFADARAHLRLDDDSEQDVVTSYVAAATDYAETQMVRALVSRTIEATFTPDDRTGCPVWHLLPIGPVQSVTTVTVGGVSVTDYDRHRVGTADMIRVRSGGTGPVVITYVAGYGTATQVPAAIRTAILMHVGTLYSVREATTDRQQYQTPFGLAAIYGPHRAGGGIG